MLRADNDSAPQPQAGPSATGPPPANATTTTSSLSQQHQTSTSTPLPPYYQSAMSRPQQPATALSGATQAQQQTPLSIPSSSYSPLPSSTLFPSFSQRAAQYNSSTLNSTTGTPHTSSYSPHPMLSSMAPSSSATGGAGGPGSAPPDFLQSFFNRGGGSLSATPTALGGSSSSSGPPPMLSASGATGPPPLPQIHIPAFTRLTESASSSSGLGGVSPRNIYTQSARPTDDDAMDTEDSKDLIAKIDPATTPAIPGTVQIQLLAGEGEIYSAVYSGIGVYEMMANGVAVMRRKSDGYLNATQILKVAGVDKGRRTKILDKEVMTGEHEKVQGGYGKYQGTWVPFQRGVQLAQQYNVEVALQPIFDFAFPAPGLSDHTPTKEQVYAANRDLIKRNNAVAAANNIALGKTKARHATDDAGGAEGPKKKGKARANKRMVEIEPEQAGDGDDSQHPAVSSPPAKRQKNNNNNNNNNHVDETETVTSLAGASNPDAFSDTPIETNAEKYRAMLMAMFVHEDPSYIPDILSGPVLPPDLDLDIIIDDQGHTSLHWAAALARINVVRVLLQKGADIRSVNNDGETALIRAVRVTNNYDTQTFPELLHLLHPTVALLDAKRRNVLHHIAATAGLEGRVAASRYYAECFLEWVARHGGGHFATFVDPQDYAGDTPLNVAARVGNRNLVEQLVDVGADPTVENRAGVRPIDFGFEDLLGTAEMHGVAAESGDGAGGGGGGDWAAGMEAGEPMTRVVFPSIRTDEEDAALALSAVASANKGGEIASVQQMVDEMSQTFTTEMAARTTQLDEVRSQLRQVTRELANVRKMNQKLREENETLPDMILRIRGLEGVLGGEMARVGGEREVVEGAAGAAEGDDVHAGDVENGVNVNEGGANGNGSGEATHGENGTIPTVETLRAQLATKERTERHLRSEIARLRSLTPSALSPTATALTPSPTSPLHPQPTPTELLCKKLISQCCSVPLESVDAMLDPLLKAVESDREVDVEKVGGFMMGVRRSGVGRV
ncbi:uncharacterized protein EV422DRAFT_431168 [Fimicolochytrium jonesii]|uniref:uncharacterized protein n=1 Tax=Fimicolochytrium jonesii TaxID=1396493 RepID=UPI0022FDBAA3|nr:uncharacterized protein EV422DRAFT_431168 [Fimicolochytrium jonesii]KAI8821775.1 hypothetical protein EV422DRAFT_431168 [Fimicolochytrium jonesii]